MMNDDQNGSTSLDFPPQPQPLCVWILQRFLILSLYLRLSGPLRNGIQ